MRPPTENGRGLRLRAITGGLAVSALLLASTGCGDDEEADDDSGATSATNTTVTTAGGGDTTTSMPGGEGTVDPTTTTGVEPGATGFGGIEEIAGDLGQVAALDVDADGTVWATENASSTLYELADDGPVEHYVGEQVSTDPESAMSGLAIAPDGMIWFATRKGIHRLDPETDEAELVVSAAGTDLSGPMYWLAVDAEGVVYVADTGVERVFRVDGTAVVPVAGSGEAPVADEGTGDGGPALEATFGGIRDIAIDDEGNIYVADDYAQRIRRVSVDGTMDTVVGGGSSPVSQDAEATDEVAAVDLDLEAPSTIIVIDDVLYVSDVILDVVISVDGDGVHQLVLPSIDEAGSVEHLAGIDATMIYASTPDLIGRLVP